MMRLNETAPRALPVLPLPSTVLFPGIVLPLQLSEPQYREMIHDVLQGAGTMAAVMHASGAAEAVESAAIALCDVGCLARVIHAERLADGRYNVLLHGLQRVRLVSELPREHAYRCFMVEAIPRPSEEALELAAPELARLNSCVLGAGAAFLECDQQLCEVLRSTSDPLQLTDILCATLVQDPQRQQLLLATGDLRERLRAVIEALAEAMAKAGALPPGAKMN